MICSVKIDGRTVEVPAGASILQAAARAGIAIPTLCHHPALPPDGSCRMCLVEVTGHPGLHPACVFPASAGFEIETETAAVQAARRHVLRLLLERYRPGVGRRDNELLSLAARYGLSAPTEPRPPDIPVDESNPFIRVDRDACIHCWRCVRACDLLNGVAAIGVFGRGEEAHVGFGLDGRHPAAASTGQSIARHAYFECVQPAKFGRCCHQLTGQSPRRSPGQFGGQSVCA